MKPRVFWLIAAVMLSPLAVGCQADTPANAKVPHPDASEVWLTEGQAKEAKVEVAPADERHVNDTVLTSGKVAFDDTHVTHVFSPVAGRVTSIVAQLGQHVHQGDPLAIIESPDIGIASSDVGKSTADLIAAEHDFKRQKELFAAHAASQKDYEQAEDAYRKAKAELDRANQKMRLLRGGSVDGVTQTFTVRASIDGEVVTRAVNPGMEVQGQYAGGNTTELFTIGNLDQVWVVADVFEMDVARVKVGSPAAVHIVSYPERVFTGTVDWVSGVMDPTTRTAKVRCRFDNADRALKPEMYATVQITVDERHVLAIPRSSLLRLGDQTVVFVEKGQAPDGRMTYERVPVTVEDESADSNWLPVTRGLETGTRIVTSGAILLAGAL